MKKLGWCIVIWLCGSNLAQAQASKTFRVKDGEEATKVIPAQLKYRYPEFQEGKVVYLNGKFSAAAFNYNLLLGEVQFIHPKGDTLSLAAEAALRFVEIGESTFLYDHKHGYLEVVGIFPSLKLGRSQRLRFAGAEKVGAYNQSTGVSSIRNTSSYVSNNSQMYNLKQKGDVIFSEEVNYFLIDKNNQAFKADKSTMFKVFPQHKKAISAFLKENSLELNKEEDLKKLLQFCTSLEV